jgi:hypothetical protein
MLFFIALAVITAARTNARFEIAQTSSALHFTRRAVVAQG